MDESSNAFVNIKEIRDFEKMSIREHKSFRLDEESIKAIEIHSIRTGLNASRTLDVIIEEWKKGRLSEGLTKPKATSSTNEDLLERVIRLEQAHKLIIDQILYIAKIR